MFSSLPLKTHNRKSTNKQLLLEGTNPGIRAINA
jgi:hypothetical protein